MFDKDLCVLGCRKDGISLPLPITEHWSAQKELSHSVYYIKISTSL